MSMFSPYWKCKYDELITFYPRYYREVYEMDAILRTEGELADGLQSGIDAVLANGFILEADEKAIASWENLLGITYGEELTLDQRRAVVIARLLGFGHIGEQEIRDIIAQYTSADVEIDFDKGIIYIVINAELFDEDNMLKTLTNRIPAHLALDIEIHIERAFEQQLNICFGGAVGTDFVTQPVGEDRTSKADVPIAYSGFLSSSKIIGNMPDTIAVATSKANNAGGVFCVTHTKSKLID